MEKKIQQTYLNKKKKTHKLVVPSGEREGGGVRQGEGREKKEKE